MYGFMHLESHSVTYRNIIDFIAQDIFFVKVESKSDER